jgi:hypothetical protein
LANSGHCRYATNSGISPELKQNDKEEIVDINHLTTSKKPEFGSEIFLAKCR